MSDMITIKKDLFCLSVLFVVFGSMNALLIIFSFSQPVKNTDKRDDYESEYQMPELELNWVKEDIRRQREASRTSGIPGRHDQYAEERFRIEDRERRLSEAEELVGETLAPLAASAIYVGDTLLAAGRSVNFLVWTAVTIADYRDDPAAFFWLETKDPVYMAKQVKVLR